MNFLLLYSFISFGFLCGLIAGYLFRESEEQEIIKHTESTPSPAILDEIDETNDTQENEEIGIVKYKSKQELLEEKKNASQREEEDEMTKSLLRILQHANKSK